MSFHTGPDDLKEVDDFSVEYTAKALRIIIHYPLRWIEYRASMGPWLHGEVRLSTRSKDFTCIPTTLWFKNDELHPGFEFLQFNFSHYHAICQDFIFDFNIVQDAKKFESTGGKTVYEWPVYGKTVKGSFTLDMSKLLGMSLRYLDAVIFLQRPVKQMLTIITQNSVGSANRQEGA